MFLTRGRIKDLGDGSFFCLFFFFFNEEEELEERYTFFFVCKLVFDGIGSES
jgi:hypothetical protein